MKITLTEDIDGRIVGQHLMSAANSIRLAIDSQPTGSPLNGRHAMLAILELLNREVAILAGGDLPVDRRNIPLVEVKIPTKTRYGPA